MLRLDVLVAGSVRTVYALVINERNEVMEYLDQLPRIPRKKVENRDATVFAAKTGGVPVFCLRQSSESAWRSMPGLSSRCSRRSGGREGTSLRPRATFRNTLLPMLCVLGNRSQNTNPTESERGTDIAEHSDEAPRTWNVGDVIADLYEVTGVLGEGAFGIVHRVHHRGWDMDLAVKSPKEEILSNENVVRRESVVAHLLLTCRLIHATLFSGIEVEHEHT